MKLLSRFNRLSILQNKYGEKYVQINNSPEMVKFNEAKHLGRVNKEKLTHDECKFLLHY